MICYMTQWAALSQLISISLFLEGEGGWELAEQLPNNKILKGMHNILIMPNTTPIETAKIWGNFPRLWERWQWVSQYGNVGVPYKPYLWLTS